MQQNKKLQIVIGLLLTVIISVAAVLTPYMIKLRDDQDQAVVPTDPGESLAANLPTTSTAMPNLIYKGGGPSGGTVNFEANKQYYIKLRGNLQDNLPGAFNLVSGPWRPTEGENTGWPGIALYEMTSDKTQQLPENTAAWECTSNCTTPIALTNGFNTNSPIVKNELNDVQAGSTIEYLIIDHADADGRVAQFAVGDQVVFNVPVPSQSNDIAKGNFQIPNGVSGKLIYQGNDSTILWGYYKEVENTPTPSPEPLACGEQGCNTDSDCNSGLVCTQTTSGAKYCSQPEHQTACNANPNTNSCCSAPNTPTPTRPANTPTPTITTPTPPASTPTPTPQQCRVVIKPQSADTTPTPTAVTPTPTQGPTPTPGAYSCGYSECTDDNSCAGDLICIDASDGKSYCSKPENDTACINNPGAESCCGPFYSCGHSPCDGNDSCVGINNNYSCVLAANGEKYCAENNKIESCIDNPTYGNCCTSENTPTPTKPQGNQPSSTPTTVNNPTTTPTLPSAGNSAPTVITTGIGIIIIAAAMLLLF